MILDVILHVDTYLGLLVEQYGFWVYFILFLVILCETGLVIAPFLPGDSLLFAAGALSGAGSLGNPVWLFLLLSVAAVIGDSVNYWIGKNFFSQAVFREGSRYFKKEYLDRTQQFYELHGGKAIVLARFVPIIRTFAPFVAGIGQMNYTRFLAYNVIGAVAWVGMFIFAGFFFGNISLVKENFSIAILVIIALSFVPVLWEYVKHKREKSLPEIVKN